MKKTLSLLVSFLILSQNFVFAQTYYPSANEVQQIYNKIAERAASLPTLKKIADDTKTTPMLILSSMASVTGTINNKRKFGAFLKELHIPVEPDASIIDISDAAYQQLKRMRVANGALVSHIEEVYEKSEKLILEAVGAEPQIINHCEEYLKACQEDIIQKELKKMKIPNLGVMLEDTHLTELTDRFIATCDRAGVEVGEFLNAYHNLTLLPKESVNLIKQEKYFNDLVEDFFAYRGEYIALREIETMGTSGEKLIELTNRYYKEAAKAEEAFYKSLDAANYYNKVAEETNTAESYHNMISSQYKADDLSFKYTESQAKKETIDRYFKGEPFIQFTKKGGLFIAILGAIYFADKYMKNINTKQYVTARNNTENLLRDMLSDNTDNLFSVIASLPEKAQKSAFTYIAEDYYDNFSAQAADLIFALAMLDNTDNQQSSTPAGTDTEMNQEFEQYFDKNYKILKEEIGSNYDL